MPPTYVIDEAQVRKTCSLLFEPGQVFEVRCLDAYKPPRDPRVCTRSGYFDDVELLLQELKGIRAKAIYVALNEFKNDRLAMANNKLRHSGEQSTVKDSDITRRRWLLIDCDPERTPKDIPSTDEEHENASEVARLIRDVLTELGWPQPIYADSGNGDHLLYRIDLPNDEESTELLQRVLKAIAQDFDTDAVKVDQSLFNAGRIDKLYGTWACKGDHTPSLDREHRLSRIVESPDVPEVVGRELLEALANTTQPETEPEPQPQSQSDDEQAFDMEAFLTEHNIPHYEPIIKQNRVTLTLKWHLHECPLCEANGKGNTSVTVFMTNGKPGFKCLHSQCAGKKHWIDFRKHFEPNYGKKEKKKRERKERHEGRVGLDSLIDIDIEGQVRDVGKQALGELEKHARNIYIQDGKLIRVGKDEHGTPTAIPLAESEMLFELTHSANYVVIRDGVAFDKAPPKYVVSYIKGVPTEQLHFPVFTGFVRTPVLKPDGSILQRPGYDADTGLVYMPSEGMERCNVLETPTYADALEKVAFIEDYIGEFCYKTGADRANAYGLLLSPFIRPYIKGHIPLALIDAPEAGTGKGLLSSSFCLIWTSEEPTLLSLSESENEMRKLITTALKDVPVAVLLDQVDIVLKSGMLAKALTSTWWGDRYLSTNNSARLRNNAVWMATGNNLRVEKDMVRRVYRIRLDAEMEHPDQRDKFRHDLLNDIPKARPELVSACLTIIRYWYTQGQKSDNTLPALGTFTQWARTIGGILASADIIGFLTNLEEMRDEVDTDASEWLNFLLQWHVSLGSGWQKTQDVIDALRQTPPKLPPSTLPCDLQTRFHDEKRPLTAVGLGMALTAQVNKRHGARNARIERNVDKHTKQRTWRVVVDLKPQNTQDIQDSPSIQEIQETQNGHNTQNAVPCGTLRYPTTLHNGFTKNDEKKDSDINFDGGQGSALPQDTAGYRNSENMHSTNESEKKGDTRKKEPLETNIVEHKWTDRNGNHHWRGRSVDFDRYLKQGVDRDWISTEPPIGAVGIMEIPATPAMHDIHTADEKKEVRQ